MRHPDARGGSQVPVRDSPAGGSPDGRPTERTPVIGVSLKMYFDAPETLAWTRRVAELARTHPATKEGEVMLFVLPSFPSLAAVIETVSDSPVTVGAQDVFWEDRGAYTGAVSGRDLRQLGCELVEVGHMERRRIFGDDDGVVNRKVAAAIRNGLRPIICIGEERPQDAIASATDAIAQLESATLGLDRIGTPVDLIVAYEPEWAIGAEHPANPDHITAVIARIRDWLEARSWLAAHSVIYGGGAGPGMLSDLDGEADGLFLGRFAHDPDALSAVLDEMLAIR